MQTRAWVGRGPRGSCGTAQSSGGQWWRARRLLPGAGQVARAMVGPCDHLLAAPGSCLERMEAAQHAAAGEPGWQTRNQIDRQSAAFRPSRSLSGPPPPSTAFSGAAGGPAVLQTKLDTSMAARAAFRPRLLAPRQPALIRQRSSHRTGRQARPAVSSGVVVGRRRPWGKVDSAGLNRGRPRRAGRTPFMQTPGRPVRQQRQKVPAAACLPPPGC